MDLVLYKSDLVSHAENKPIEELTWCDFKWYARETITMCHKVVVKCGDIERTIKDRS